MPLGGAAQPAAAVRRLARIPQPLEPGAVVGLLASCDRGTVVGRRDVDLAQGRLLIRQGKFGKTREL